MLFLFKRRHLVKLISCSLPCILVTLVTINLLLTRNAILSYKDLQLTHGFNYHLYFTIPSFLLLLVPTKNSGDVSLYRKRNVLVPAVLLFVILSIFFLVAYKTGTWANDIFALPVLIWNFVGYVFLGLIPFISVLLFIIRVRHRKHDTIKTGVKTSHNKR